MANNQNLKDAIAEVIKTNGNNEITGQLMQDALFSIINQFGTGSVFAGVASPDTIPENNDVVSFYLAYEKGIYVNFQGYDNSDGNIIIFNNKLGLFEVAGVIPVVSVVDSLSSYDEENALSANMGRELAELIASIQIYGAVFLGYKASNWQPTADELSKSFFIYATAGTYTSLGNITVDTRETALIYNRRVQNQAGDWVSEFVKYSLRMPNMLINTDGYIFGGYAVPNNSPVMTTPILRYIYVARVAGTYTNYGGLVVGENECAFLRYTPNSSGTEATWDKIVISYRGDIVVAADDSPEEWKSIADVVGTATDGIGYLPLALNKVKSGGKLILAQGSFTVTNTADSKTFNINKSCEIVGQGLSTIVSTNGAEPDIRVATAGINVIVRNMNVKKGVALARANVYGHINANLEQYNIWHNGTQIDTDLPNFIFKHKYITLRALDTPELYRYYALGTSTENNDLPLINQVGLQRLPDWDGGNLESRTICLLPGNYKGTTGVLLRSDRGNRIIGVPGYADKTTIENLGGTLSEPNDFYANSAILRSDLPQVIENVNFKRHINHKHIRNLTVKGCYRDGVEIEYYDSKDKSMPVGYGKLHSKLDYAMRAMVYLPLTNNTERWAIHVYGETREVTGILAYYKNVDLYGHNAKVIRVGLDMGIASASGDAITPTITFQNNFDGEVHDITFIIAGVQRGYNVPAINIGGKQRGSRYKNVNGINLMFPAKRPEPAIPISADLDGRIYSYTSTGDGNFTKTEYSKFDGSVIGTETVTNSVEPTHQLPIRKMDNEIEKIAWEDYFGGRLYGILVGVTPESDVEMRGCRGYGSPWGFHNTRGIYINYGKVRAWDCIGVGGGIGHRNHGIVNHRNTETEMFNCIGIGSPFAYLTPNDVNDRSSHNGIKFQMMAAGKLVGCIGYGNNMPMGNGIALDMRTQPNLFNCVGYNGGGENSTGLFVAERGTVTANGGYFGANYKTSSFSFVTNEGKGMKVYPYKNPVRHDGSLEDVLYNDHWDAVQDDVNQGYRVVNLTVNRSNNIVESGLGGVTSIAVYTTNGTTKTLISKSTLVNINGNYQYMPVTPVVVDAANGEYLYFCLEYNSNNQEADVPNNLISLVVNTTEVADGLSASYMNQYWSHESDIPVDTTTRAVKPTTLSGATLEQDVALRIGEKADITQEYNLISCTLKGETVKDVPSSNPVRKYNCVDL